MPDMIIHTSWTVYNCGTGTDSAGCWACGGVVATQLRQGSTAIGDTIVAVCQACGAEQPGRLQPHTVLGYGQEGTAG